MDVQPPLPVVPIDPDPPIRAVEPPLNDTCKQVLRFMFTGDGRYTFGHPSSVALLPVIMTEAGYAIAVREAVDHRMKEDYLPPWLDANAFFAAHDLLALGLVEWKDEVDG